MRQNLCPLPWPLYDQEPEAYSSGCDGEAWREFVM